jgi:hypothetical protein
MCRAIYLKLNRMNQRGESNIFHEDWYGSLSGRNWPLQLNEFSSLINSGLTHAGLKFRAKRKSSKNKTVPKRQTPNA